MQWKRPLILCLALALLSCLSSDEAFISLCFGEEPAGCEELVKKLHELEEKGLVCQIDSDCACVEEPCVDGGRTFNKKFINEYKKTKISLSLKCPSEFWFSTPSGLYPLCDTGICTRSSKPRRSVQAPVLPQYQSPK